MNENCNCEIADQGFDRKLEETPAGRFQPVQRIVRGFAGVSAAKAARRKGCRWLLPWPDMTRFRLDSARPEFDTQRSYPSDDARFPDLKSHPATNLFLTVAWKRNVNKIHRFGDSTGTLSQV
jgi:hypothetical protein